MSNRLSLVREVSGPISTSSGRSSPAGLVRAGKAACFAVDEFFYAWLSNAHTRTADAYRVDRILAWCEEGLQLH